MWVPKAQIITFAKALLFTLVRKGLERPLKVGRQVPGGPQVRSEGGPFFQGRLVDQAGRQRDLQQHLGTP